MHIIAPKGHPSSNWGTQSHSPIADSESAVVQHLQKWNLWKAGLPKFLKNMAAFYFVREVGK